MAAYEDIINRSDIRYKTVTKPISTHEIKLHATCFRRIFIDAFALYIVGSVANGKS